MSTYFIVAAYDISDNARRNRVVKSLKKMGFRVQWSIFEADIEEKQLLLLKKQLKQIMDPKQDRLVIYQICKTCKKSKWTLGSPIETGIDEIIII